MGLESDTTHVMLSPLLCCYLLSLFCDVAMLVILSFSHSSVHSFAHLFMHSFIHDQFLLYNPVYSTCYLLVSNLEFSGLWLDSVGISGESFIHAPRGLRFTWAVSTPTVTVYLLRNHPSSLQVSLRTPVNIIMLTLEISCYFSMLSLA